MATANLKISQTRLPTLLPYSLPRRNRLFFAFAASLACRTP
jgi:hypothetical protein